jgi:hypothetical protein
MNKSIFSRELASISISDSEGAKLKTPEDQNA